MDKSESLGYHFQPYGTVYPWNSRLQKILPNGMPAFEPVPLDVEPLREVIKKLSLDKESAEDPENQLLIERYMKNLVGTLNLLRSNVEKYCIIANCESRQRDQKKDFLLKNADVWVKCENLKSQALKELYLLQRLFQYAGYTKTDNLCLAFQPSITPISLQKEYHIFATAVSKLWQLNLALLQRSEQTLKQIRLGRHQQRRFMTVINQLKSLWNIQRVTYAFHVYEKGDDYPYRAEILVQLMTIPSNCWAYERPGFSLTELVSVPPPYLSWLPFPAVPPTAPAMAQIFFTSPHDATIDSELGVQINWIGDAVHCIKNRSLLSVKIIPMRFTKVSENKILLKSNPKYNFETMRPPVVGIGDCWAPETKKVHEKLQSAQWNLVDRAIHLIFQAQAARLKSALDAIAYDSIETANAARLFLQLYEDFEIVNSKFDLQLTIERWDPTSLALALQKIPIYSPGSQEIMFFADVEIWIFYRSEDTLKNEKSYIPDVNKSQLINYFCESLPLVELFACTMLRHYFLTAWKFHQTEIPKVASHINESLLSPFKLPCGARLFPQFIDWIYTYLSTKILV